VPLFTKQAVEDPAASVRLELASALQRVPVELREPLAAALVHHGEDINDHNLPLMLWYGIEPIASALPTNAIRLAAQSRFPIVREYIARRLGEELPSATNSVEALLQTTTRLAASTQADVLRGLAAALQGWHRAPQLPAWKTLRDVIASSGNAKLHSLAEQLGVVFGDPRALAQLEAIALQQSAEPEVRRSALQQLIDAGDAHLEDLLPPLLEDPATAGVAARGLLRNEDPSFAAMVIQRWPMLPEADRPAVVGALVSRRRTAAMLLEAMAQGTIPCGALGAFQARQILNLNDPSLGQRLTQVWGQVQTSDADKKALMDHYRVLLSPDRLKAANPSRGRELFSQVCAACHKLYGQGAAIGPELTGGGRANLDYLLENIVDPNAIVPQDYRVSEVELKDDRSLTGLIVAKSEHTITLQSPTEKLTIERGEISRLRLTSLSLMPEGLLQGMKEDQICNLVAYLMKPTQVPLPSPQDK
jgi:putative heme-binding domain-containing protein